MSSSSINFILGILERSKLGKNAVLRKVIKNL
jgi:hypothetical protein